MHPHSPTNLKAVQCCLLHFTLIGMITVKAISGAQAMG